MGFVGCIQRKFYSIIEGNVRVQYGKSEAGTWKQSMAYWGISLVWLTILIVIYSREKVTITQTRSTGGPGCTINDLSAATEIGSLTNFNAGTDCKQAIREHVESASLITSTLTANYIASVQMLQILYKITYSNLNGASLQYVLNIEQKTLGDARSSINSMMYSRCGFGIEFLDIIKDDHVTSRVTEPCRNVIPTPIWVPSYLKAETYPDLTPDKLFRYEYWRLGVTNVHDIGMINTRLRYATNGSEALMCATVQTIATYTCKEEITHSLYGVILFALTLLTTLQGFVLKVMSNIFGSDEKKSEAEDTNAEDNGKNIEMIKDKQRPSSSKGKSEPIPVTSATSIVIENSNVASSQNMIHPFVSSSNNSGLISPDSVRFSRAEFKSVRVKTTV